MRPLLSIGMIFKNDMRTLDRCLSSLTALRKEIPCELVMADTGSTDGSKQVAEKYADILFDFPWINDFAAARNAVLDRCSGKWHMFIDCDEWLDENFMDLATFLRADIPAVVNVAYLRINNLLQEDDFEEYAEFDGLRLAKCVDGLHFEGAVHEHYVQKGPWCPVTLGQIVLWHDGYIPKFLGDPQAKQKRNMPLIKKELEKHPNDPLLLDEMLDAAYTPRSKMYYARIGMNILHSDIPILPEVRGTLWRKCVKAAQEVDEPECVLWAQEGINSFPLSPYVQIDANLYASIYAFNHYNWEACRQYIRAYFAAIEKYENGEFGRHDFGAGSIDGTQKSHREFAMLLMARTYLHEKDWENSGLYLKKCIPEKIALSNITQWLNTAHGLWEHIDLRKDFRRFASHFSWEAPLEDKLMERRQEQFKEWAWSLFSYEQPDAEELRVGLPEKAAFPLLLELGECDLYYGAKVMLSDSPEEIRANALKIEDWKYVSAKFLLHLIEHHVALPEQFFTLSAATLETLAGNLITMLSGNQRTSLIMNLPEIPGMKQMWVYDLTLAIIRTVKWDKEDPLELMELWKKYCSYTRTYLTNLYHSQILEQDMLTALPDMYAFGWCCVRACESKKVDERIHWLRKGLKCAPVMKKMVTFLSNQAEKETEQQEQNRVEMKMLASQIQKILSAYPADHPSVLALKQTPAYQQVKDLLES